MLRGFRPGSDLAFLETWVPDEEHFASIFGIFQAAEEAGVEQLTVLVGPETTSETLKTSLQGALSKLGAVEIKGDGEDTAFTLTFDASAKKTARDSSSPQENVNLVYRSQVNTLSIQSKYHQKLTAEADFVLVTACYGSTLKLMALVDKELHTIKKARYSGASTPIERALLEGLCPILEDKPILECSDHAVIELEYHLRDHLLPAPIAGVLMPDNCDPMFSMPLQLVRGLLADYKALTGYDCLENFYVRPSSPRWQKLSDQERRTEISAAIDSFSKDPAVHLLDLEGDRRVVVEISPDSSGISLGHHLMQLERHLQQEIEPTLQVHLPAKADLNTIHEIKRVQA
jgi:hypothetical protein